MIRSILFALATLVLCLGTANAADKDKMKKPSVHGKIKKVDAETGTITVTTADKDVDVKVEDATSFKIHAEGEKKAMDATGKDGLKNDQVKEGAVIAVVTDDDGKAVTILVGKMPMKKPK